MDKKHQLYVEQERPRPIVPMAVWGGLKYEVLGHVFADGNGKVLSHEDAYTLIQSIRKGYENFTPQQVAKNNAEVDKELEEMQGEATRCGAARILRPGYVYLMSNGRFYKVGVSTDPERRRQEIEKTSGFPVDIMLSIYVDDPYAVEKDIHDRLFAFRVEGEWFNLPTDVLHDTMDCMRGLEEVDA